MYFVDTIGNRGKKTTAPSREGAVVKGLACMELFHLYHLKSLVISGKSECRSVVLDNIEC